VSRVAGEMDALRIALGEVDVLATLTAGAFDAEDWVDPDPDTVEGVASLLGLIQKSAAAAKAAFHRLHGAVADAAPAPAGETWDYEGRGTALGEDASARDAEVVRRLRERLAEALGCPTGHPFFREDWLPGEDADEALIRIFHGNKRVLDRSDDDVIRAIVEHARRRG